MILRRLVLLLVGSVVALSVLGSVALVVELSYRPTYDQSDPNYRRYAEAFDRLSVQLGPRSGPAPMGGATNEDFVDFSHLNNGEWKTACLLGGYTDPLDEMQGRGATISEKDRVRMTEARSRGFRLGAVEESEMAIAYVDLSNNAHFIHFATGIGRLSRKYARTTPRSPAGFDVLSMPQFRRGGT